VARATFPKLVITGAWDVEAPGYPPGTGDVLQLVAATVADKIKADLVRIPAPPSRGERPAHQHVERLERRPRTQSVDGSAGLAGDEVELWITATR
jgi:hypothetical protein